MSNPNPASGSPDKEPATEAQAAQVAAGGVDRAATATAPKRPAQEPRPSLGRLFLDNLWAANTVTVTVLAVLLAMLVGAVLIIVSDPDVLATYGYITARPSDALNSSWTVVSEAYANLFKGAIFDPEASGFTAALSPISETLTYTAPLVFTGLSVALAFRGGLFNIGAQGQATIGVILAALAGFLLPLPPVLHLIVAVLAGAAGGALWGFIPGILKARTGAHEVINTIMLNYVALYFLSWIIVQSGVQNPNRADAISRPVDSSAQFPRLLGDNLRVHAGILLAVLATWFVAWLLNRSTFGFELRAVGANPDAARTAGISVPRTYVLMMAIAGLLAGLGGSQMVLGSTANALTPLVIAQIGFDGILVALLGRVKPWGVLLAALLFGALQAGGNRMQGYAGISLELVTVLQALIVIFIAAPALVKAIFQLRAARAARLQTSLAKGW
ncbi:MULTISPECIES: ABC transporter permease [Micromonospora]|uniref:ABC transporter permease n=1 Tax=Micromonospora haikouensis TaxID=686309 RepID=A0A0D0X1T7_9ACTN|nr:MULTISPECIES: ABC transporter permease [Micromonospora]KIR65061.1 ABC transporter permease [Micromonospora haikouensis]MDI5937928.1 ABC transporter permease [Micromonospora sp. DH15]OON32318.1 ABC transporter permease [Micromonospora sp. Rc5]